MNGDLADQLTQLELLEPGSHSAEKLRADLEHRLMQVVLAEGLPGVRRLIRMLSTRLEFDPVFAKGSVRAWRYAVDDKVLEIQTNTGRSVKSASIAYCRRTHPSLSPTQRARHSLQQEFYARYSEVGPAGRLASSRLSSADRLVRSIGDLEADLNNGGFAQYLRNKGRIKAAQVLRQLRRIGARRTAELLESALRAPRDSPVDSVDAAYYRRPDDLASMVMRALRKGLV